MDINETGKGMLYRHPWELSRTKCLLDAFGLVLDRMHESQKKRRYINVGAGDLYFDQRLLARYEQDEAYAVDLGYDEEPSVEGRIHKFRALDQIEEEGFDYCIMMDSLEYMEDDAAYVRAMAEKLRPNGCFFFTLPAHRFLFSEHDRIVGNLRRYDVKSFDKVLKQVPELEKETEYHFYNSLFMVRLAQKVFRMEIDPEHKVTTGWEHSEKSLVTKVVTACLNLDFAVNRLLAGAHVHLPGLSLLVICRKK